VLAKVHLGYSNGVALATVHSAPPMFGNIISDRVRGIQVLQLWSHTFPMNAKTSESRPMAALWRPVVSVFQETEIGLSGLERRANGQWVAQRWMVQPMSFLEFDRLTASELQQRHQGRAS
jgi:hypothetical protein